MKFRTISRLVYLKRARHRHGHGIHSPFLFNLITTVVENRKKLPEYGVFKNLKHKALNLLNDFSDPSLTMVYHEFNLAPSNPRRLYRKVEMPLRYGKVIFRLIREFKPSAIINYGPTWGINLALIALSKTESFVYQSISNSIFELVCNEVLKDSAISNIHFFHENSVPSIDPEFIVINYPFNAGLSQDVVRKNLQMHGDNDVLVIRGIHNSKEMEAIWQDTIASESVRVSLDLFEIGIALFRKGLQKENFIQRF